MFFYVVKMWTIISLIDRGYQHSESKSFCYSYTVCDFDWVLNSCCELTFSDLIRECARDRTVHILNFSELAKILDYFIRLAQRKVSDGEISQFRRNDVFGDFSGWML